MSRMGEPRSGWDLELESGLGTGSMLGLGPDLWSGLASRSELALCPGLGSEDRAQSGHLPVMLSFLRRKAWPLGKAQPRMQQLLLQQALLASSPHPSWWKLSGVGAHPPSQ